MAINQSTLTKGQLRKLSALRKSIGDELANEAFEKWLKRPQAKKPEAPADPVAKLITETLKPLEKRKDLNLGRYGYTIKRAKGKGASGIVITRNEKPWALSEPDE